MPTQDIIGIVTVIMAIALHIPYLICSIQNKITPHPFTWILWTTLTAIIFFAQFYDNAGPGAWGTATVAIICFGIVIASLKNGFQNVKKIDVILFISGLLAIPIWFLTNDPTLSVILIVTIDLIAFVPTYRKSWSQPYQEPLYLYSLNVIRHGLSLFALTNISIATALFPFVIMLANGALAVFLVWRRQALKKRYNF